MKARRVRSGPSRYFIGSIFALPQSGGVIFTLDTALAIVALGGSYVRMLSVIVPGASMIFGFLFSRNYLGRLPKYVRSVSGDDAPRRLERISARHFGGSITRHHKRQPRNRKQ